MIIKRQKLSPEYSRAFTLTETLIVVSLIAMIGLTLYQALANGLKIWQRSRQYTTDEDVLLLFDKMGSDIRQALIYSQIEFEKKETGFAFPALISTREDRVKNPGPVQYTQQIGKVEYYFSKGVAGIFRRQANYGQALKNEYSPAKLLVQHVNAARFGYFYSQNVSSEAPHGEAGFMPSAMLVEIEVVEPSGQIRRVKRFFNIPIAARL